MALEGAQLIEFLMRLKLDPQSAEYAKVTVKQVKDGLTDLGATATKDNTTLKQLTQTIAEVQRVNQIDKLARDMASYGSEIENSAEKAAELAKQLEAIGATQSEVQAAAKAYANYSNPQAGGLNIEALKRSGGALNALGASQIGLPISLLGDLQQVSKELTAVAGATGLVDGAASALVPVLGATAGGFLAALAPLAAVGVALAPLLIALKILSDREQAAAESAKMLADVYAKEADAYQVGQEALRTRNEDTKKAAEELFNSLNDNYRANVDKIAFLNDKKSKSDEKTAAEIQKTIDATYTEQIKLSGSIDILRGNLQELGVVVNGTAPGLSKVVQAAPGLQGIFGGLVKVVDTLGEAKDKLTPFIEAIKKTAEEAQKRADQQVKIVDKLNSDLKALDTKGAEDRLSIDKKLADTLVDIQSKASEAAKSILADLEKQQKQAALKLTRDDATAKDKADYDRLSKQINFQRAEVKAQQDTERKLKQIREQAASDQFEIALDRDFAGLSRSRRGVSGQLNAVVEQANADQQARLQAAKDKQDDDLRQYLWDHEQRVKTFEQQKQDAIAAANEALKQNEADRKKARAMAQVQATMDIIALQDKLTKEYNAKRAAAIADLNLVNQTEAEKQKAYQASYKQAQDLLNGLRLASGGIGGRLIATRALGGSLQSGQVSTVNELPGQRESFETGGNSYLFPNGAGIFTSFKAGNVSSNSSSQMVTVAPTFNISGSDPKLVAREVGLQMDSVLKKIFRVRA